MTDQTQEAMRELPALPMPDRTIYGPHRTVDGHYFSAKKMREYGQLCTAKSAEKIANLGECDECGTPYSYDPTDGGTICVKCLREKIARLEAERGRHDANNKKMIEHLRRRHAAAELSNRQLRDSLGQVQQLISRSVKGGLVFATEFEFIKQALAQQPSTEALDAYVASKLPVWQPIETAPKNGELICLATMRNQTVECVYGGFWSKMDCRWLSCSLLNLNPTHWMPLQPAPKE